MIGLPAPWLLLAGATLAAASGFAGGYALRGTIADAEIATVNEKHALERAAAARETARRFSAAQSAERRATTELHDTSQRLALANKRLKEAINELPNRSDCGLSGRAVSLLNGAIDAGAGLSANPGEPGPAPAAAAGDSVDKKKSDASEQAVAGWIADTIAIHDACRARIDAIRRWDEVTHGEMD